MTPSNKITLTDKQTAWLVKHFKHTKNAEIAERLGISESSLHRMARSLGLKKTRQFQAKCQEAAAKAADLSHRINGTYPKKGYRIPRSEEFQFKSGVSNIERLGARKEAARLAKVHESLSKTRRLERGRALFGLPQQTKLRVVRHPQQLIKDRHYLKKCGYILDERNKVAYWTPETRRAKRLEAMPKRFYTFKQHEESPLTAKTSQIAAI